MYAAHTLLSDEKKLVTVIVGRFSLKENAPIKNSLILVGASWKQVHDTYSGKLFLQSQWNVHFYKFS